MASILELTTLPIEQIGDLDAWSWRLGQWFASRTYPVRYMVQTAQADLAAPQARSAAVVGRLRPLARAAQPFFAALEAGSDVGAAVAALSAVDHALIEHHIGPLPDATALGTAWHAVADRLRHALWPLAWQADHGALLSDLAQSHLRTARHFLVAWAPPSVTDGALAASWQQAAGRAAQPISALPAPINGPYRTQPTYLEPERGGDPYLCVLVSHQFGGTWDARTLGRILALGWPASVVIDVQTIPYEKAQRSLAWAHKAAQISLSQATETPDVRAESVTDAAHAVLHDLRQQALHLVTVAILIQGASRAELEQHIAEAQSLWGSDLKLSRIAGCQDELLRLWSTTPTRTLDVPRLGWNMLSHGVGCLAGVLGYHQPRSTEGLLWAVDALRRAPIYADPFQGRQAGHLAVFGSTGSGKTFFLNTVITRAALAGWKVILLDIAENGVRLAEALGAGCQCSLLGLGVGLNLLDRVIPEDAEGGWIGLQVQHVVAQLALLLGSVVPTAAGGVTALPRSWTIAERGVLDRVLSDLYTVHDSHAPMPTLRDLVRALRAWHDPEYPTLTVGQALAEELHLYLSGAWGDTLTRPTSIDWDFSHAVNSFDFKDTRVPPALRPFFYGQTIGAIYRYMLDPSRDRSQPTLVIVDEAGIVALIESVAQMLADLAKRGRKDGVAVVLADQNPTAALDNPWLRTVVELAPLKAILRLDAEPAQRMAEAVPALTPEHIQAITHAQPGQGVLVVRDDVYMAHVVPSAGEWRAYGGS